MAYDITIDELFPLRSSFSFKKTASYFCGTCPRLVCRKKLHACILPDSRTFVSPNSISGICSRSTRNFVVPPVSLQSLFMPSPSQRNFFSPSFPPPSPSSSSRKRQPELFQGLQRCCGRREVFIYQS